MLTVLTLASLLPTAEKHDISSEPIKLLWDSGFGLKVMYEIPGEDHAVSSPYQLAVHSHAAQQSMMPPSADENLLT